MYPFSDPPNMTNTLCNPGIEAVAETKNISKSHTANATPMLISKFMSLLFMILFFKF